MHLYALAAACALAALPTSNDAATIALGDAHKLPPEVRCNVRYLWVRGAAETSARAGSLAVNYVSRDTEITRPAMIGKDGLLLLRVDLYSYAAKASDRRDIVRIWEEFQNDPVFSRFITKATIKFNPVLVIPLAKRWVEKKCEPYSAPDGNTYNTKWIRESYQPTAADLAKIDVIRTPSEAIDPEVWRELCDLTGSEAPIVSLPYFVYRALSTIEDDGVFKEIWGGLYYDFAGYKRNVKGKTDLDGIFESIGLPNADKFFEDVRADRKIAMIRSGVTGRERAVAIFPFPGVQDGGVVRISLDLQQSSVDLDSDPFANLLDPVIDGQELIFTAPNQLHRFAALDGKRKLVQEVPDKIAHDTTIPSPHPQRLQGALGCIACHGPNDGVQPLRNQILDLAKVVNILGDQGRTDQFEANRRITRLYAGDPERGKLATLIRRVKDDYASAVLAATGPWPGSPDQSDVVRLASAKLADVRNTYVYELVTPARALIDLGVEPGPDPVKTLKEIILVNPGPLGLEDVRFAPLLAGIGINRFKWDLQRDFIAVRVKKEHRK